MIEPPRKTGVKKGKMKAKKHKTGAKDASEGSGMVRKSFKYRCYPNKRTMRRARDGFRTRGRVWSIAVEERRGAFEKWKEGVERQTRQWEKDKGKPPSGKDLKKIKKAANKAPGCHISDYDQYALIRKRGHPEYADCYAQSLQEVLRKLDASYKSFMQLRKNGDTEAMPPKPTKYYRNIAYRQSGWKLEGNKLRLKKIGEFRIRMHRPVEGRVKMVEITEKNGKWYATFSCEAKEFSRVCRPVAASRACLLRALRQEYTSTGGSDPEKGGTDNNLFIVHSLRFGGSDPEKGGTDNSERTWRLPKNGGSDPEKGGTDNQLPRPWAINSGGSDPEKGGTDNNLICRGPIRRGGSDPEKGGTDNLVPNCQRAVPGGSDPEKGGGEAAKRASVKIEFLFWGGGEVKVAQ